MVDARRGTTCAALSGSFGALRLGSLLLSGDAHLSLGEVLQADIGFGAVCFDPVSEGWFPAGIAFPPCHRLKTPVGQIGGASLASILLDLVPIERRSRGAGGT
jgi:hypothetical protein